MTQTTDTYLTEHSKTKDKTYAKCNEKIMVTFTLCFCIIIALIFRIWGIGFGLPIFNHPDERAYLPGAVYILHTLDLNPNYFHNPPLLTYMYSVVMFLYFLFGKLFGWFTSTKNFQELFLSDGTNFYVIARSLNALLSSGICLLVYIVGKKLFDKVTGLIASLLLCSTFLIIKDSHYAVTDIPGTFFLMLSFTYIIGIYTRGRAKDYMLGGLFAGMAVATKYNMGIVIIPLVLAHFLSKRKIVITREFMWAILGCFNGFILCCPWILLDYRKFWADFADQYMMGSITGLGGSTTISYGKYLLTLTWGYGLLPLCFFVIGAICLWRRKETQKLWILLCFPLVYYLLLGGIKMFYVRFAVPLIPYMCVLSAYGIISLTRRFSYKHQVAALVLLTLVSVSQGIIFSCIHNHLITQTDTRLLARNWINDNLPHGSKIVAEGYSPSLKSYDDTGSLTEYINDYQVENVWTSLPRTTLNEYRQQDFEYIITSSYISRRYQDHPLNYPQESDFYTTLERETDQIFKIMPAQEEVTFKFDEVYSPFWNLFALEKPGPTITIYKIN